MKNNLMLILIFSFIPALTFAGCKNETQNEKTFTKEIMQTTQDKNYETAVFGSGCFWCTEAIFEMLKGVDSVESGYAGGHLDNPTYEDVCSGETGHAEVCKIFYDPKQISYEELLEVFWRTHDPTTLNRQGADVGTQYRSAIFYNSDEQKKAAEFYKKKLDESGSWSNPIVTEISPLKNYYSAEKYHQDYFANNPTQGYCSFVIAPKLEKFEKVFKEKLK